MLYYLFFDEAAKILQQYEIASGSKYTLRIYHSFFPLSMTGVEVGTEGATYIPTLSIPVVRPWIATTLSGPHHLTCGKSSFLGAHSWVSPAMT